MLRKLKEKGFFHIFGTNVINQMINFCSGILLVRIFSQTDYGVYSFAISVLSVFLMFNGIGTIYGMLQFGSENQKINPKGSNAYYIFGFKVGIIFDILLTIAIVLYCYFTEFPITQAKYVILAMAGIPICSYLLESTKTYFRAKELDKIYSIVNTSNAVLIFFCTLLGALVYNLYGAVLFKYVGYTMSVVLAFYYIRKNINKNSRDTHYQLTKSEKLKFLKFSVSTSANNAMTILLFSIDVLVLGFILKDPDQVAVYKTASLIPYALNFIPISLGIYLYPKFARNNTNKNYIKDSYKQVIKYFTLFNLLVSAVMVIAAPLIIKIIFGVQYQDSVLPFRILSFGYFISATFRTLSSNILTMLKKVKIILIVNIVSLLLNTILNVVFVYCFGFIGAAIATIIVFTISSLTLTLYLIKWLKTT